MNRLYKLNIKIVWAKPEMETHIFRQQHYKIFFIKVIEQGTFRWYYLENDELSYCTLSFFFIIICDSNVAL